MEQQRIADLQEQLHHAESAAMAGETRAALLDTRQNEARAIYLKSIGKLDSFNGQASGFRNIRLQFTAYCRGVDVDMRRDMEEASRGEVPILTGSMRRSRQVSTALLHACAPVSWRSDGGHGERA